MYLERYHVFYNESIQNQLSPQCLFPSGDSQPLETKLAFDGKLNMLITKLPERKRAHKVWRVHKPLPQIPLSEYGWFGAEIGKFGLVYGELCG